MRKLKEKRAAAGNRRTKRAAAPRQGWISAAGFRVVKLLVGNPPQTVSDLIRATGVTRTAITEQLNELVDAGFVHRELQRLHSRGRPRHLYSATNSALLLLFSGNQHLVVPAIWKAFDRIGGPDLTKKVVSEVSRVMADHYAARITGSKPRERLDQLVGLLREEGVLLDLVVRNGETTVRKRSCPFLSMADDKRHICTVDLEMMNAIVGAPVRQIACRLEGDPCCAFVIDGER